MQTMLFSLLIRSLPHWARTHSKPEWIGGPPSTSGCRPWIQERGRFCFESLWDTSFISSHLLFSFISEWTKQTGRGSKLGWTSRARECSCWQRSSLTRLPDSQVPRSSVQSQVFGMDSQQTGSWVQGWSQTSWMRSFLLWSHQRPKERNSFQSEVTMLLVASDLPSAKWSWERTV